MAGKIIGYIRVSSFDQNPERQLEGMHLDKVFTEKVSGKSLDRPQLEALLNYVRDGDTIIVHSLDRLARNLDDLRQLVKNLTAKEITIKFIKENLTFTGEDTPMSNLLLSIMGAFAEFERAIIGERQKEGIAIAQKKGLFKGRRPALNLEQIEELKQHLLQGKKKSALAKELRISRVTLDRYLKEIKEWPRIEKMNYINKHFNLDNIIKI